VSHGPSRCPSLGAAGARGLLLVLLLVSCTGYRTGGRLTPDADARVTLREAHTVRATTLRGDTISLPGVMMLEGRIVANGPDSLQIQLGQVPANGFRHLHPGTDAMVWLAHSELSRIETRRFDVARSSSAAAGGAVVVVAILGVVALLSVLAFVGGGGY
jgi:hypothetical protein